MRRSHAGGTSSFADSAGDAIGENPDRRRGNSRYAAPELGYHRRMNALTHQFPVSIDAADIDFMGHVNNAVYLTWVQEAVISHWRRWAPPEAIAAHLWIALKHEITYRRPAFLNDAVIATVQLEKVQRESAFYETIISRGEQVLAVVKSRWCCLDAKTLRPARLARDIVDHFFGSADGV
jgi:acyl-CoA thioester hydrolase